MSTQLHNFSYTCVVQKQQFIPTSYSTFINYYIYFAESQTFYLIQMCDNILIGLFRLSLWLWKNTVISNNSYLIIT